MKNFKYSYNENFFEKIDNEIKAYWLGFLYADGGITVGKRSKHLEITLGEKDKNHLTKFVQTIQGNMPITEKIVKLKGKEYKSYRVTVCSSKLCEDLIKLGCTPNKSLTLIFPQNLEPNLYAPFIRGYLDGDGTISTRCRISICGTYEFLNSLQQHLILELDVTEVKILSDKRAKHYQYERVGANALKIMDYLYSEAEVYLDRKYDKAIAYLNSNI